MGWVGEHTLCDARHAIRLKLIPDYKIARKTKAKSVRLKCVFRRFFFDGLAVGKYEIGVGINPNNIPIKEHTALISHVLDIPVIVHNSTGPHFEPLVRAGKHLAKLYSDSSTENVYRKSNNSQDWWVMAGTPFLFIEVKKGEVFELPHEKQISLPEEYEIRLGYSLLPIAGFQIRVWTMSLNKGFKPEVARQIRIYLMRLNAENETLRLILRNVGKGRINGERDLKTSELLQEYLNGATRKIQRWERKSERLLETEIAELIRASEDFIHPGKRDSLLDYLRIIGIRKNIFHKIEKYTQDWNQSKQTFVHHWGGKLVMGDEYNVSGQAGAVGPGAHAHDMNFTQIGSQLEKSMDLAQLAEELSKLRQAMKVVATDAEHDIAVSDIARAEQAAKTKDSSKVAQYLQSAGKWTLEIASKIGVPLATEALKKAIGM